MLRKRQALRTCKLGPFLQDFLARAAKNAAAGLILQCRGAPAANSAAALPQARKYGDFLAANTAASLPQALAASGCVRSTPPAAAQPDARSKNACRVAGEPTHPESRAA